MDTEKVTDVHDELAHESDNAAPANEAAHESDNAAPANEAAPVSDGDKAAPPPRKAAAEWGAEKNTPAWAMNAARTVARVRREPEFDTAEMTEAEFVAAIERVR